jgi:hypothetical protein
MSTFLQLLSRKTGIKARGEHNPELDSSEDDEVYVDPRIKEQDLNRQAALKSGQQDYGMGYLGDNETEADAVPRDDPPGDIEVSSTASTVECEYEEDLHAPTCGWRL